MVLNCIMTLSRTIFDLCFKGHSHINKLIVGSSIYIYLFGNKWYEHSTLSEDLHRLLLPVSFYFNWLNLLLIIRSSFGLNWVRLVFIWRPYISDNMFILLLTRNKVDCIQCFGHNMVLTWEFQGDLCLGLQRQSLSFLNHMNIKYT